ncbi:MAG TPA: CoA pyrophosphatase [Thermoplasmata archaeon]|nr:CoA pyrophosphatase [Thermoplasmata archaeon]
MSALLGRTDLLSRDPPPREDASAAVVAVLRPRPEDLEVFLIERTRRADDPWSGQVSMPGGRTEPNDADLRATALRELEEEVGLRPNDLVLPARYFATFPTNRARLRVAVFVARLADPSDAPAPPSNHEVAGVFWLPAERLRRTERTTWRFDRDAIEIDAAVFDGHIIWGFTRSVLLALFGFLEGMAGYSGTPLPKVSRWTPQCLKRELK